MYVRTAILAVLTLLAYPHLAYLHARIAVDSKRAEFRNLTVDSVLMGMWMAQMQFALWPSCGALLAISLDNAVCGGSKRFLLGLLSCAAGTIIWAKWPATTSSRPPGRWRRRFAFWASSPTSPACACSCTSRIHAWYVP